MHRELTTTERERVLNQTTGRDGLLVRLLLMTGCRISEALNLRTDDVVLNVSEPYIRFRTLKRNKGDRFRIVPMRQELIQALNGEVGRDGWLFPSPNDHERHITRAMGHIIITRAFQLAGINEASSHSCRATFISRLHRANVPIGTIADLTGHSTINATQRCIRITTADRVEAIRNVTDSIPNFKNLMNLVLQALHQMGRTSTNEALRDKVAELLNISEEQSNVLHNPDKSNQTEFECQLAWAKSYLKKYGIINNTSSGIWTILEEKKDIKSVDVKDVLRFYQIAYKKQRAEKNRKSKRIPTGKHHHEEPPLFPNTDNNTSDINSDDDIFADLAITSESKIEDKEKISEDFFGSHDEEDEASIESNNAGRNHYNQATKTIKEGDCINEIIEYFQRDEFAEIKAKYKNTLQIIILFGDDKIELEITLDPYLHRLNIFSYVEYDPILADRLLRVFSRQDIVSTLSIDSSKLRDHYLIKKTIETEKYNYDEIIDIINRVVMDVRMVWSNIKSR